MWTEVWIITTKSFILTILKVSYLIVDEAIIDLPMEQDPFEAAGHPIPSELPYNNEKVISKST